jgi:hypothetical protein
MMGKGARECRTSPISPKKSTLERAGVRGQMTPPLSEKKEDHDENL